MVSTSKKSCPENRSLRSTVNRKKMNQVAKTAIFAIRAASGSNIMPAKLLNKPVANESMSTVTILRISMPAYCSIVGA